MKINATKLDLAIARSGRNITYLRTCGLAPLSVVKARRGEETSPVILGKIAKALNCDPADLIEEE